MRRPFTGEEIEVLWKEGLTGIYPLTGETIADQKKKGSKFWIIVDSDHKSLLTVRSLIGEVAVNPRPRKFFLPKSNNLTLDEQLEMVAEVFLQTSKKT